MEDYGYSTWELSIRSESGVVFQSHVNLWNITYHKWDNQNFNVYYYDDEKSLDIIFVAMWFQQYQVKVKYKTLWFQHKDD